jgi:hypothetical protein
MRGRVSPPRGCAHDRLFIGSPTRHLAYFGCPSQRGAPKYTTGITDADHGVYTTIDPPGSVSTSAISINDKGDIAGFYNNDVNGNSGGTNHGFLAEPTTHGHGDTFVFNFGKGITADLSANAHAFDHGLIANSTTPEVHNQASDFHVGTMIGVDSHEATPLNSVTVAQQHNHVSDFHLL